MKHAVVNLGAEGRQCNRLADRLHRDVSICGDHRRRPCPRGGHRPHRVGDVPTGHPTLAVRPPLMSSCDLIDVYSSLLVIKGILPVRLLNIAQALEHSGGRYKYYGDTRTMNESFPSTYAYIKLLDTNPAGIEHGLGDWMPVEGTSTAFTGPGFLHMSYLAFANITEILGKHDLAEQYRAKAAAVAKVGGLSLCTPPS